MSEAHEPPHWKDLAYFYPELMQRYVQENGPVPDGPISEEDWETFRKWAEQDG